MSKPTKNKLVPALRFPEFKNIGEWVKHDLDSFCSSISSGKDISDVNGDYDLYGSTGIIGKTSSSTYKGNFILAARVGANAGLLNKVSGQFGATDNTLVLTVKEPEKIDFIYFSLDRIGLNKIVFGSGQPLITGKQLKELDIPLPPKSSEQKKIADCLSSLDELIAAEDEKLDALKDHKKGLMQQLFPTEGKTLPALRFPGFKGEWEEKSLGELGQLVSGLTYSPDDVREEGLLVLRSSNIQNGKITLEDCVYVKPEIKGANISKPNDILICVRNGSKALIGKNALIPEGMPLSTHGAFMSVFRSSSAKFVYQLFQTNTYNNQVASDLGATINSINGSHFVKYKFFIPRDAKEQQKIADCLSSVDEFIASQSEKIEQLKEHKKGLMQQLFPSLNDIDNG